MDAPTQTGQQVDGFEQDLRDALAAGLGAPDLQIEEVDRSGGGNSWETYVVTISGAEHTPIGAGPDGRVRLAIKRQPEVGMLGTYDVEREVELLNIAAACGCPAPRALAHRLAVEGRRGFYAMNFVDGVVPSAANLFATVPDPEARHRLGMELAQIMARLHSLPVADMPAILRRPNPPIPQQTGERAVQRWRETYLDAITVRIPILDLAFAWLARHTGDVSDRVALIHNDLHVGNFIANGHRVGAVLDWETAEVGDPACDIAKFNLPTFRAGTDLASGLIPLYDLIAEYRAHTGWAPSPAALRFWTVLSLTKSATILLNSARTFSVGGRRDVRWGNMSFRAIEHMRWLVILLERGEWGNP